MRGLVVTWAARGAGLAIGIGLVALLAWLAVSSLHVIALAFIAILLAAALEPFIGWVRSHTAIPRGPVILLVYLAFFALVVAFAVFVLPAAFRQAEQVMRQMPSFLDEVDAWAAGVRPEALGEAVSSLTEAARGYLTPKAPGTEQVVQIGLTLAEALTSIGAVLALVFFWLVGHARLQRYSLAFVPLDRRGGVRRAWNEIEGRLGMWFRGQLILMGTIGVMCGAAYFVLGVPSALLLGLIAAICEAIPLVGPILGAVPAVLAAATVSPELVLLVVGVTAVIQVLENNVLVPVIMRNTIGLSPLIVTLSLLVGAAAGGIPGALLAVPVAAAIEVILGRLQDRAVPVAQDPGAVETPDEASDEQLEQALPDARRRGDAGMTPTHR
jgi:predicted PurR-regulated permease PerM